MGCDLTVLVSAMEEAVATGVFPGCQLVALEKGALRVDLCAGREAFGGASAVTPETIYDLASLTKPLAGLSLVLHLVNEGQLDLTSPIKRWVSDLTQHPLGGVTLSHLLSHTSGLPAWKPFYEILAPLPKAQKGDALNAALRECSLDFEPGERRVYSDIGFLLLQEVVETVAGASVGELYNALVRPKLPPGAPCYAKDLEPRVRVAPTEACPWRQKTLCGEVHDDNTWSMGGEALHAGLFGTARGVAFSVWEMHRATRGEGRLCGDYRGAIHSRVPLGVDRPSPEGSASGHLFSPGSWGHLGFTGTSFWVDPARDLVVVLLSNRVHPSRENLAIREFRPRIHDLLMSVCCVTAPEKA